MSSFFARVILEIEPKGDLYVFVEGLYSMTGDMPDISKISELAARRNSVLVIDDAHATGTIGRDGRGAAGTRRHSFAMSWRGFAVGFFPRRRPRANSI